MSKVKQVANRSRLNKTTRQLTSMISMIGMNKVVGVSNLEDYWDARGSRALT